MDCSNKIIEEAILKLTDAGVDIEDARIEVADFFDAAKDKNLSVFDEFISRRVSGEPAAYILGKKAFYKSEFNVTKGVLIPRSDTEILVEAALKFLRCLSFPMGDVINVPETYISHIDDSVNVADLCTGTGCIGVSIHKELKSDNRNVKTTLVDISEDALKCAKTNIEGEEDIEVIKCDVLNSIEVIDLFGKNKLDIIVSNPPYIDSQDMSKLDKTVKDFEPELALFGGPDGMDFYGIIAKEAMEVLKTGGALMVEHGYNQGERVRDLFAARGFSEVMTLRDYGNNDRVTIGITK